MTDATNTAAAEPIVLELLGPGPNYANKTVWLPQLFMETARAGSMVIEGRRFENCLIEGPAVLLPLEGCNFDGCNMGDAHGDPRNLMLSPQGPQRVTGPIPFKKLPVHQLQLPGRRLHRLVRLPRQHGQGPGAAAGRCDPMKFTLSWLKAHLDTRGRGRSGR
ncbi:Uncharacterised protein [Brevundimonas vancanneytii]|uniref:Uncharacterized protein n=1 Tax=Brevundimonas vancanneytii TaxID=1325724 RepID=A0A4P1KJQ1_9CAUL|nr:Uncharacterised protein [Brevundimonas vancanneytii]